MGKGSITFVMLVKNITLKSEKNFIKTITSASRLSNNFIIVDNGSSDNTISIINKLEKKLKLNLQLFEDTRKEFDYLKYVYSKKVSTQYIFVLDDDEILSTELIHEINNNLEKNYDLFNIKWNTYIGDNLIAEDKKPTLFSKKYNILSGSKELHKQYNKEKIRNLKSNKIYTTKHEIQHISYPDLDFLFKKSNLYSKYEAETLFKKNKNISFLSLVLRYLFECFIYINYSLFFAKGYKHSFGILFSFHALSYKYKKYFFYWGLKKSAKK